MAVLCVLLVLVDNWIFIKVTFFLLLLKDVWMYVLHGHWWGDPHSYSVSTAHTYYLNGVLQPVECVQSSLYDKYIWKGGEGIFHQITGSYVPIPATQPWPSPPTPWDDQEYLSNWIGPSVLSDSGPPVVVLVLASVVVWEQVMCQFVLLHWSCDLLENCASHKGRGTIALHLKNHVLEHVCTAMKGTKRKEKRRGKKPRSVTFSTDFVHVIILNPWCFDITHFLW